MVPKECSFVRLSLVPSLLIALACGGSDSVAPPAGPTTGTFTLAATPATVPILQGGEGEATIAIARGTGSPATVTLSVTGAPAGLTATFTPSSTQGTSAILVVTSTAAVATGDVTLTVTGNADGHAARTATVTVDITPNTGGGGNVTVDYSTCPAFNRPRWFAYQDGTGPWTQILGAADVYRFNVASAKGGFASVGDLVGSVENVAVSFASQAQLTGGTIFPCGPGAKTVSGTVTGQDFAHFSLGLGGALTSSSYDAAPASVTLTGVRDGNQDLIAFASSALYERAIIRRDQNIASGGTFGALDFSAAEAFAPATATLTVTGADDPDLVYHSMRYLAGAGCPRYILYDADTDSPGAATSTMRGIPAAQQRATDFHRVVAFAYGSDASFRSATETFHVLADRTVAIPPNLPQPTITVPTGGHKRIQAALTLPPEYLNGSLELVMGYYPSDEDQHSTTVSASSAWLGGATATLAVPDFSGVTGWRSSFLPSPGAPVGWRLTARSASAGPGCAENARIILAEVSGGEL
jgi:hypothetical protein